jgi:hypothetical protein
MNRKLLAGMGGALLAISGMVWGWSLDLTPQLEVDQQEFPDDQVPLELIRFRGVSPGLGDQNAYYRGFPDNFPSSLRSLGQDLDLIGSMQAPTGEMHVLVKSAAQTAAEHALLTQAIAGSLLNNGWVLLDSEGDGQLTTSATLCHDQLGSMRVSFFYRALAPVPPDAIWNGFIISLSPYWSDAESYISCAEEQATFSRRAAILTQLHELQHPIFTLPTDVTYEDAWSWASDNRVLLTESRNAAGLYAMLAQQLQALGWVEDSGDGGSRTSGGQWFRDTPIPEELQINGVTTIELSLSLRLRASGEDRYELQMSAQANMPSGMGKSRAQMMDCSLVALSPLCLDYALGQGGEILVTPY